MKLPDTEVLQYDEYFLIADTWKLEWERGVQVPVDTDAIPPLVVRLVSFSWLSKCLGLFAWCCAIRQMFDPTVGLVSKMLAHSIVIVRHGKG